MEGIKGKLEWRTEEELQKDLKERIDNHIEGNSRDGYVLRAEGIFEYKDVKYLLRVLRYYNHTDRFCPMGSQRISDSHCVVEYPEETEELKKTVDEMDECSEFLYHDTLHSWNDTQTIEEQINQCHECAKQDIDSIPDLIIKFENKIESLKKLIDKFKKAWKL